MGNSRHGRSRRAKAHTPEYDVTFNGPRGLDQDAAARDLTQLISDPSARTTIAGAYATGYATIGLAQVNDDGPEWFHDTDPVDLVVLGCTYPKEFRDAGEFGNARTAWLRHIRDTLLWAGIRELVDAAVNLSNHHGMPIDDGSILLALCSTLKDAHLDDLQIPVELRPENALAEARFVRGCPPASHSLPEISEHSQNLAIDFMNTLDATTVSDDTCAEQLRDGLYLLDLIGLPVRTDSWTFLIALFVSLCASDEEPVDDLGGRAHAWALGLEQESPFAAVVDTILLASEHDLEPATTLSHLFALPQFMTGVDDESKRWHSEPGTDLVPLAFEFGHKQVRTRSGRMVQMDSETREALRELRRLFREKFGRDPNPDDPILFDPDEEIPTPMAETTWSKMLQSIAENASDPRISSFAFAASEVGYLVTEDNQELFSQSEKDAFYASVEHHRALQEMNPVELASFTWRHIIKELLDGSAESEAPRRIIENLVNIDEANPETTVILQTLVTKPLIWLNSMKQRGISEVELTQAIHWLHAEFGEDDYCGITAAVAVAIWGLPGISTLEEKIGKPWKKFTLNDLHELFDIDLAPGMIWLCTGLTATIGEGKIEWIEQGRTTRKSKKSGKSKTKSRKKKKR
ncbi:hypothetical protein [Nocardia crassostreae]|uniref:hypothetical protein n=1 Tax=Nocardia crassostreae TaxID=53428 RepID=UPI000A649B43|nr:hypothetical protein [Nocardia crassostreae]